MLSIEQISDMGGPINTQELSGLNLTTNPYES